MEHCSDGAGRSRREVLAAGAAAPVAAALARLAGAPPAAAATGAPAGAADLTLTELLPLLESRALSARELVEACIARVERFDPVIRAFLTATFDDARAGAAAVDEARAAGRPVGPLAGVPVGLKDVYYTKGIPAWNLNGFPALSVPVGLDGRGLPVGLQLASPPLSEARLLSIAIGLDEDVGFFRRRPPILEAAS